jgi:hypothetical protein
VKLYRRRLDAVAPGLPLTLSLPRARSIAQLYEEKGIDLEAIAGVPGVALGVSRSPTGHLWKLYRRQETKGDAELYDLGNPLYAEIRRLSGGAVDMVCEHNTYFETFRNSICPDRFNTYFQSLDVKPWGRNFLKTLVYDVALFDAKTITIGDQPIGTLGNEREAREFAQAFRALPALPFKEVFSEDGVVCRARGTKNGIYLYLVNLKGEEVTVSAEKASSPVFRQLVEAGPVDLSTGRKLQGRGIMLLPYQLRSFLVARGFSR